MEEGLTMSCTASPSHWCQVTICISSLISSNCVDIITLISKNHLDMITLISKNHLDIIKLISGNGLDITPTQGWGANSVPTASPSHWYQITLYTSVMFCSLCWSNLSSWQYCYWLSAKIQDQCPSPFFPFEIFGLMTYKTDYLWSFLADFSNLQWKLQCSPQTPDLLLQPPLPYCEISVSATVQIVTNW